MAGEWELVTRTKKDKKNSAVTQQPPKEQIANAYKPPQPSQTDNKKDKNPSQKKPKEKKNNAETEKQSNKENKKPPNQPAKPKLPKTIEHALETITADDLWESYNVGVGSTTISRLLDVARFLNTKICADQHDEIYSTKPLNYPLSVVPSSLRKTLENIVKKNDDYSRQLYLELCLSSIANNMNKGLPAAGYKLIIQLLATIDPQIFPSCCGKIETLMGSYQNKPSIGLSLLWAIGQAGLLDFNIGVQVWYKAMVPCVDLRNYAKFIVSYAMTLLKIYTEKKITVTPEDFVRLFDFIHSKKKGIPKDLEVSLNQQSPVLRKLYFEKSDSWKSFDFMESLLARLPSDIPAKRQNYDLKTKEILLCLVEALRKKDTAYGQWKNCHEKYSKQSAHVLNYIVYNWKSVYPTLKQKEFKDIVTTLKGYYKSKVSAKKDEQIQTSIQLCETILSNMASSKSLCWAFAFFIIIPAIAGVLLALDIQSAGTFDKSKTGQLLDNVGALEVSKKVWSQGLASSARGYKWLEKNVPEYYTSAADFSRPYYELTRDFVLVGSNQVCTLYGNVRNLVSEKAPVVYATIDQYAPGFLNTIQGYSSTAWGVVKNYSCQCYNTTTAFLTTRVFIDNWAPEVLQAKTLQALNTTQTYAVEYYNLFYKYVDDYSKLQ